MQMATVAAIVETRTVSIVVHDHDCGTAGLPLPVGERVEMRGVGPIESL
jgi:hypothetical protein